MPTHYEAIEGWFDFDDIYDLAIERYGSGPARFVEIGAYKGRSTCYMAERLAELDLPVSFDVVDSFAGDEHVGDANLWPVFADNMERAGLLSRIVVHRSLSVAAAEAFGDASCDFVFIDATHTYEAVSQDLAAWWPKVKPGGLFAGHDYAYYPGVKQAVDEFVARHGLAAGFRPSRGSWLIDR